VVCLAEWFVGADLWDFFTRGKHFLQTEQVTVDALTVGNPCGVLQRRAIALLNSVTVCILLNGVRIQDCSTRRGALTVSQGFNMVSAHALLSLLALLITSVLQS